MSAPPITPIPAYVALGGTLLISSTWTDAAARCRAQGAVCVAVEGRTGLTHVVPDEATWRTLSAHCDFYSVSRITADRYLRTTE